MEIINVLLNTISLGFFFAMVFIIGSSERWGDIAFRPVYFDVKIPRVFRKKRFSVALTFAKNDGITTHTHTDLSIVNAKSRAEAIGMSLDNTDKIHDGWILLVSPLVLEIK